MQKIVDKLPVEHDKNQKGKLYESLARNIFESYYLKEYRRGSDNRYSTGQIDVYFQVKRLEATIFHEFSDIMIVECKNWEKPATKTEINDFSIKMKDNKCNVGIMFSKGGVTGDIDSEFPKDGMGSLRRISDRNDGLILVYTHQDVLDIISGKNVYNLLVEKYYNFKTI